MGDATRIVERVNEHCSIMIYCIAAFACLGGFLFGYDLGLISGALLIIKKEMGLSSEEAEIIVSGYSGIIGRLHHRATHDGLLQFLDRSNGRKSGGWTGNWIELSGCARLPGRDGLTRKSWYRGFNV